MASAVTASVVAAGSAQAATLLEDQKSQLRFSMGGFLYGAAHLDTNETAVRPWVNQVSGSSTEGALSFEPFGTRTNFAMESMRQDGVRPKAFLEMDWGPVTHPRIRHAYVQVESAALNVLVGQYWVPFGTPGPDTYNPQWFYKQGNAYARAPQLTVGRAFGAFDASLTAVSATSISGTITKGNSAAGTYTLADRVLPVGLARFAYRFKNNKAFVSATGGVGRLVAVYKGATGDVRADAAATSWFGELAFAVPVSRLVFTGKAFMGAGSGMGTGVGQSLVIGADDRARAIPVRGGFLSAKAVLTEQFSAGASLGIDDPLNRVNGVDVPIRNNVSTGAHVTWNVQPGVLMALEWEHVATTVRASTGASATNGNHRFSVVGRYSF